MSTGHNEASSSSKDHHRWASLADRLNPNRAAYDSVFKASWKNMSKQERNQIIYDDQKAIRALKERGKTPLPFDNADDLDSNDHCETSSIAYSHIAPILELLARQLDKSPKELQIYDPYYCAGATVQHLQSIGFDKVYNKPEDFYKVIEADKIPSHDVVVTNPPYSGDHFDRLVAFLKDNGKPFLLLLPDHFAQRPAYLSSLQRSAPLLFLTPPQRYHYWTPEGRREANGDHVTIKKTKRKHSNLYLGTRNSPFNSLWFISLEPVLKRKKVLKAYSRGAGDNDTICDDDPTKKSRLRLAPGCLLHKEFAAAKEAERTFRGDDDPPKASSSSSAKQKPKRRKKEKEDGKSKSK
jgi:uncharacterized protein (UPF0248 family)